MLGNMCSLGNNPDRTSDWEPVTDRFWRTNIHFLVSNCYSPGVTHMGSRALPAVLSQNSPCETWIVRTIQPLSRHSPTSLIYIPPHITRGLGIISLVEGKTNNWLKFHMAENSCYDQAHVFFWNFNPYSLPVETSVWEWESQKHHKEDFFIIKMTNGGKYLIVKGVSSGNELHTRLLQGSIISLLRSVYSHTNTQYSWDGVHTGLGYTVTLTSWN